MVQSVDRAFALLAAVGNEPATLSDLARTVDLPLTTTSRLLATLEDLEAVERMEGVGKFRIGPAVLKMASSLDSSANLAAVGRPVLYQLMEELGEAAGLSVPAGYTMHYIDQVDTAKAVQVQDWVGTRVPLHLVSSGLVMLAHWPVESIENFLSGDLQAATPQSVTAPEQIRQRLRAAREQGVAWTVEELEVGISSVAAPVFNGSGETVAAVHLHGPSFRFPSPDTDGETSRHRVEQAVKLAANRLSELVGPA